MPRLNNIDMENKKLPTGSYGYSAVKLDSLGASEYTIVTLAVDVSGSVAGYKSQLESTIREVVNACKLSPRADNLMIRLVTFNNVLEEVHGYKLLEQCNLDDYKNFLRVGGSTALFDASENAIQASANYGKSLLANDFSVNGIVVVVTDGEDNVSAVNMNSVKSALEKIVKEECMERLLLILATFTRQLGLLSMLALEMLMLRILPSLLSLFLSLSLHSLRALGPAVLLFLSP